jgi:hypothetical protein
MQNKSAIRNFQNSVYLRFAESGENFTMNVPHYNKWIAVIRFLKRRGWEISENPTYKEHYAILSQYHKIGYKGDVALLMEIGSNSIKVEFGNIKNLWAEMKQSFWSSSTDERTAKLTYMEAMRVKLEIYKLLQFCKKYNHEMIKEDAELSPEEYIINKLQNNTHIHGKVTSLNDIKLDITPDKYDWKHNSNDKNQKKIICGETKCFYDYYTRRLSCGVAWHNINNMWWVICNGVLRNIAACELFDFEQSLPRRKPLNQREVAQLLNKFEDKREYDRCVGIKKHNGELLQVAA